MKTAVNSVLFIWIAMQSGTASAWTVPVAHCQTFASRVGVTQLKRSPDWRKLAQIGEEATIFSVTTTQDTTGDFHVRIEFGSLENSRIRATVTYLVPVYDEGSVCVVGGTPTVEHPVE